MTMPDPIQPQQPRREFMNYSGNLNICLTARTWLLVTYLFALLKNHLGGKCFADDEDVETELQKWLRQQSKDFCTVGFDSLLK
jgi:hypothetical protein